MAKRSSKSRSAEDRGWLAWWLGSSDNYEGYLVQSRSLALSLVLIAPLLLVYEVALILAAARPTDAKSLMSGALGVLFHGRAAIVLNIIVMLFVLLAIFVLARRRHLRLHLIVPMAVEGAVWAAVQVGLVVVCFRYILRVNISTGRPGTLTFVNLIGAVGAGVYEEILFRLLLLSLLYLLGLHMFRRGSAWPALFAVTVSSILFAAAHQLVGGVLPLRTGADWLQLMVYFTFGVYWATLYTLRGLGVAVYAHVVYDLVAYLGQG